MNKYLGPIFFIALCFFTGKLCVSYIQQKNEASEYMANKLKNEFKKEVFVAELIPSYSFNSDYVNIDSFFHIYLWYNSPIDSDLKEVSRKIIRIIEWRKLDSLIEPNKIDTSVKLRKIKIKVTKSN